MTATPSANAHRDGHIWAATPDRYSSTNPGLQWRKNRRSVGGESLGSIAIGQSTLKSFNIKNSGKGNLSGSVAVWTTPQSQTGVFAVTPGSFNLAPGQSQPETVTFTPGQQVNSAALIISSNDATRPTVGVGLQGNGLAGKLSVPSTFTISGPVGQNTPANLTIKNAGKGILSGDWAPVAIPPYLIDSGHFDLQPGTSTTISISFVPIVKGPAPSVALAIGITAPSTSTTAVTLKGTGR